MENNWIHPTKILLEEVPEKEEVTSTGIIKPKQVSKNDTRKGKIVLKGSKTDEGLQIGMMALYPRLSITKFTTDKVDGTEKEYGLLPDATVLLSFWEKE